MRQRALGSSSVRRTLAAILLGCSLVAFANAQDWPQWRGDAARGAVRAQALPPDLRLQWQQFLGVGQPAWPSTQNSLQFDLAPSPIVIGDLILVGSTVNDDLTAIRLSTGERVWRFQADGPVRFAAAADSAHAYLVADDGFLYAVDLATGQLAWKVQGGPRQRLNLGNHRMISAWPARGAPVVDIDSSRVYFAAGIWPFMGIFVHCVDAQTGQLVWSNSGDGANWTVQPHGAPAFATVAPQGYLAIAGDQLIVPGGRSVPAIYDRRTGALERFEYDSKRGDYRVATAGQYYFVDGGTYSLESGQHLVRLSPAVADSDRLFFLDNHQLRVESVDAELTETRQRDLRGREKVTHRLTRRMLQQYKLPHPLGQILFVAGDDVWTRRNQRLFRYRMDATTSLGAGEPIEAARQQPVDHIPVLRGPDTVLDVGSPIWDAVPAGERLVVMTLDGKLQVYGPAASPVGKATQRQLVADEVNGAQMVEMLPANVPNDARVAELSKSVCAAAGSSSGFALVLGIGTGQLAHALLEESSLRLIVIEPNAEQANRWKAHWQAAQIYGHRISICVGDFASLELPPYFAEYIVTENTRLSELASLGSTRPWQDVWISLLECLRPYGGTFWARLAPDDRSQLSLAHAQLMRTAPVKYDSFVWDEVREVDRDPLDHESLVGPRADIRVTRTGPLPQSDNWTHQYGNVAQTGISADQRVRAPLGVLWFGGTSNDGILPRHGHGPTPQVAGGRLVVEGPDLLRCLDVYTGRLLWERNLPGLGLYFDTTRHFPGASEIGSNYVTLDDYIYVAYRNRLLELDATSGATLRTFRPDGDPSESDLHWGYLGVHDGLLIATLGPTDVRNGNAMVAAQHRAGMPAGQLALIPAYSKWRWQNASENSARRRSQDWKRYEYDDANWKLDTSSEILAAEHSNRDPQRDRGENSDTVLMRQRFDYQAWSEIDRLQLWMVGPTKFALYINGHPIRAVPIRSGGDANRTGTVFDLGAPADLALKRNNVVALVARKPDLGAADTPQDEIQLVAIESAKRLRDPPPMGPKSEPHSAERHSAELHSAEVSAALVSVPYASSSQRLLVFDRQSGQLLWQRHAKFSYRHNTIVAGDDRVFAIDHLTEPRRRALQRRGIAVPDDGTLYAFDALTGRVIWEAEGPEVFGTFLSYAPEHGVVVEAGSVYRDRAYDEAVKGIAVRRARDGATLWRNDDLVYGGPCLLWKDQIITNGKGGFAVDLMTGDPTGWSYQREYGCNTALGCTNLLTFRSGAAGFYDLESRSGTANLGGFRSSCTNNLIPACGVLAAPDYTRTCNCAYQHQTSVAFVHRPDGDLWAFGGQRQSGRFGLNFGAPGDRRSPSGTLWLDWPSVGGSSPDVRVQIEPSLPETFRLHASQVTGTLPWVSASGIKNLRGIVLQDLPVRPHRLRLFFVEPELPGITPLPFDVKLQGTQWLNAFSPLTAAGTVRQEVVRETLVTPDANGRIELAFCLADSKLVLRQAGIGQLAGIELIELSDPDAKTHWSETHGSTSTEVDRIK